MDAVAHFQLLASGDEGTLVDLARASKRDDGWLGTQRLSRDSWTWL